MAGFFISRLASYPSTDDRVGKSLLPPVAAAAGWMEAMKLPLRKVYAEYTKSELTIMAWRSGEIASNMHSNYQEGTEKHATLALAAAASAPASAFDRQMEAFEERLGKVAPKLTEDLDMRKLTGEEVRLFLGAQGIHLPVMGWQREAFGGEDELTTRVRVAHKDFGKEKL